MGFNLDGVTFPSKQLPLTEMEKKVFNAVPLGKENAVSGAYLADIFKVDTRTITAIIKKIKLKHYDIGGARDCGYYRFKNYAEYSEYMSKTAKENHDRQQVYEAMKLTPMGQLGIIGIEDKKKG